ncbi:MAG: phage terminase large subunit family protein [Magnetococcales bacterium]|nr:phage terminase large subunit family protein [Magnetococcales bacterium]
MTDLSSHVLAARSGLKPTPRITVSEWADRNRFLSSVSAREPGLWRTERTPYLKEIMDCLSGRSDYLKIVCMMASQLGKTEVGLNWIGSIMDLNPGPILMVQPTLGTAEKYSKQRLAPMIDECPSLRCLVKDRRSRDSGNTILEKEFRGGLLFITGSNSAASLASSPIRYVFLDEVDRFEGDVCGEGDPVDLAIRRTNTFGNSKKILLTSTPTIKTFSRIEAAFLESDQRYYFVPCPHCHFEQTLKWGQVKYPEGMPHEAWYQCEKCEEEIQEHYKTEMLSKGRWIQTSPGERKPAGFHLNGLYAPLGWLSWGEIAAEHAKVYRDPFRLKTWINTVLAETWEEKAEKLDGEGLMARREVFGPLLPSGIVLLTAGVDVQDDRLEVEIVGWGRDEESWSVDYRILLGDPSGPDVWSALDDLLLKSWPHSRHVSDLRLRAVAIDTGGHHTMQAYSFCRSRQDRRVWGIKGVGGMGKPIWPPRATRNNKGKIPLFGVGVDAAKEAVYARLRILSSGPGYCHFPTDRDAEWFRQLTAEKVRTKYSRGRPVREWYKRDGDLNEALDCRVYSMAALYGLMGIGLQINKEAEKMAIFPLKTSDGKIDRVAPQQRPQRQRQTWQSSWMG